MRMPRRLLKVIQATTNARVAERDWGRWMELRMRGVAGSRKRGSWCGFSERRTVADRADSRGSRGGRERGRRNRAGPRRRGREIRKWWYGA